MTTTFRIVDRDTTIHSTKAPITARQLAALRSFLREHEALSDDDPANEPPLLAYAFKGSIARFSLAVLARLFDNSVAAIAVLEEAQYLGRNLRVTRSEADLEIAISVSLTIDGSDDLELSESQAFALF